MSDDKTIIHLEHYKLLRAEILQNSSESLKAFQLGISLISAMFALASSEIIPIEAQWLFYLFPPIVVSPLVMLVAQRFRQTRKIGTYIGLKVEPELGLEWERNQQKSIMDENQVMKKRITPRSLMAMSMPLMAVQILSCLVSFAYLFDISLNCNQNSVIKWGIWLLATITICLLLILEYSVIKEALEKDFSEDV